MKGIFMNINFNTLFQKFLPYLYLILLAFLINSVIFFILPRNAVDFVKDESLSLDYKKYGFYSNIKTTQEEEKVEQNSNPILNLSKYELKAVYYTSSSKGWISIEDKGNNESYILKNGEQIDGYELFEIFKNHVIFKKNSKEYKLEIKEKEISNYDMNRSNNEEINIKNNGAIVSREYLNSYLTNMEKIWNNISIKEIQNENKIEGFKIERINKDSAFAKLGLKEGDIITVFGVFKDNEIVDNETGEIISCITFKSVRDKIQGKEGYFNLRMNCYGDWIIFQEMTV